MTGGPHAETPLPISMCCATWRTIDEHDRCHGTVRLGNLGPDVPCTCRRCADDTRHQAARELYAGAAR